MVATGFISVSMKIPVVVKSYDYSLKNDPS